MSSLEEIHEVKWIDLIPAKVERLNNFGSTTSYCTDEASSCIGSFVIASEDLDTVPYRSINDLELPIEECNLGKNSWNIRFKMKEDGKSFEVSNTTTESILIKNYWVVYMLEYEKDKLFLTGYPTYVLY